MSSLRTTLRKAGLFCDRTRRNRRGLIQSFGALDWQGIGCMRSAFPGSWGHLGEPWGPKRCTVHRCSRGPLGFDAFESLPGLRSALCKVGLF